MALVVIFLIGFSVGFLAQRYAFCIFGSLVELLTLGSLQRLVGVAVAMLVFGFVHFGGYRHAAEFPGLVFLVGGLVQGVGYFLAAGCPLGLLVRLGEGSKFHAIVFVSFIIGIGVYSLLFEGIVYKFLEPLSYTGAITLPDLFREIILLFP